MKPYSRTYFELLTSEFIIMTAMSLSSAFLPIFAHELDPSAVLVGPVFFMILFNGLGSKLTFLSVIALLALNIALLASIRTIEPITEDVIDFPQSVRKDFKVLQTLKYCIC